jgi:hypothetical protein
VSVLYELSANCGLNRASPSCRELLEVERERVFNNLPRGAIFGSVSV